MNKISTKYFNRVFGYINTFESTQKHAAVGSQFETVIKAIESLPMRKKNINFLDLGCGLGNILFIAKELLGDTHKYVGIDNNQSYLDVAKAIDGQFQLMNTDLLSVQTKKLIANADFVYCYLPMPVYKDMQNLYVLIETTMKPGAYLLCNDGNPPALKSFTKLSRHIGIECCDQTDITIYKKN
jgi:ubiquinone/menaquinone biosynthesis C-methylase UbiE